MFGIGGGSPWYKQLPEFLMPKTCGIGKFNYTICDNPSNKAKARVVEVQLRERAMYLKKKTCGIKFQWWAHDP